MAACWKTWDIKESRTLGSVTVAAARRVHAVSEMFDVLSMVIPICASKWDRGRVPDRDYGAIPFFDEMRLLYQFV